MYSIISLHKIECFLLKPCREREGRNNNNNTKIKNKKKGEQIKSTGSVWWQSARAECNWNGADNEVIPNTPKTKEPNKKIEVKNIEMQK